MRIQGTHVSGFRNLRDVQVEFSPRLTALVAPNGQGKTNLLEALYAVAALRPLRSVPRSALILQGEDRALVELTVESGKTGLSTALALELRRGSRALRKDGKSVEAAAFLGNLVAVAFTPDDLDLSKGAPEQRRRFLDRAVFNTRPAYLSAALRYGRALKGRNRLLATHAEDALLDAYDETLAGSGAAIIEARARYVEQLAPLLQERFRRIAAPAPALAVRYRPSVTPVAEGAALAMIEALRSRRQRDRQRGTTSVGPHLDELELDLDGSPARLRASQGQHRALVLAIKLAEIELLTETLGEPPVLLLDDISSELDSERSLQLFEALATQAGQVVLTTTDLRHVPEAVRGDHPRLLRVDRGAVGPLAPA